MKRLERKETAKGETEECITALQEGGGNKEKDEIWWRKRGQKESEDEWCESSDCSSEK